MKSTNTHDLIDRVLRDLDAAGPAVDDVRADERARSLFARVVASPPDAGAPGGRGAPGAAGASGAAEGEGLRRGLTPLGVRRSAGARRLVAVGVVAGVLGAGSVLAPQLFGASEALAWSAKPQRLTAEAAAAAEAACDEWVRDDIRGLDGVDLSGVRPVVTEARGSLILVYETDARPAPSDITCYVKGDRVIASGGSVATTTSPPLPPVPADSLQGNLGAVFSTSGGSIRGVTGRVGSDVVGVVLDSVAKGPVTATVRDGHFGAWWPDAPTTEQKENAAGPEITGATVTLRDGSTRPVSVEELSGRTTEELRTADTGGSAASG
ncbi:hypothetical protein [Intrasporangium calvum]|uniref:Uncharacterized protein n=1 Tax=Intrasporangium calvum (strain ATCC 23552 / DSM 43043 / JCM 3097 / NBRC 12989 / NCIMB 10167 / NRRL B-3866 / 7 KIP) TaxID=710696 RepID=E6SAH0_INTC7|nr:hypothetical protein [Intrasporangium calvum]ADU47220.1 hypothetical protein Intca_0675 [Intrasporangium calvum DSM 43043]AXG12464.1 hypothetical protein DN585_02585 [Intrasporangium calvum]